jgi:hypothetical protein
MEKKNVEKLKIGVKVEIKFPFSGEEFILWIFGRAKFHFKSTEFLSQSNFQFMSMNGGEGKVQTAENLAALMAC